MSYYCLLHGEVQPYLDPPIRDLHDYHEAELLCPECSRSVTLDKAGYQPADPVEYIAELKEMADEAKREERDES